MGTNCWNRRLSLENSVKWCEQLTLVGDIVLERRRRLILTKSSEAAACAQEFLSFLEVALSSKLFFADRAFGLAICKLLDNRLQSLQMSYELLHLRTEGSKSLVCLSLFLQQVIMLAVIGDLHGVGCRTKIQQSLRMALCA